jgi:hypothetical protein
VGLERGPHNLATTIGRSLERKSSGSGLENPLERKSSGSGLENRDYNRRGFAVLTTHTHLSAKVDTNFAVKRRRSVSIVRSRTQSTEFFSF